MNTWFCIDKLKGKCCTYREFLFITFLAGVHYFNLFFLFFFSSVLP